MYSQEGTAVRAAKLISSDTCLILSKASTAAQKTDVNIRYMFDFQMMKKKNNSKTKNLRQSYIKLGISTHGISVIYYYKFMYNSAILKFKNKYENIQSIVCIWWN